MRVGVSLASLAPGAMGGSERYARQLLIALAGEPGVEVTALVPPAARATYAGRPLRFGVPRDGIARGLGLSAGLLLGRAFGRSLALDVIHHPLTVPVVRPSAPAVITLHDIAHHEVPEFFPAAERAFRRFAYDAPARRAAAVVTPSEYSRASIVERLGVSSERIAVIPYGVERDEFHPDGEIATRERPYVLYPANLWPHKNHARLIAAWSRLADRDLELVLTGRVDQRALQRLGVGGRVRHLGHVDAARLPALYRGARALVFPSLFEGFGFPVLEAMACGTPVASSPRAALAELCAGAALMFDPTDVDAIAAAIERVVGDEQLRATLRSAGLRRAEALSWQAVARRHAEVYRRVASRS
jgi:glycosyltransferase involved in cell wall biosynthesis